LEEFNSSNLVLSWWDPDPNPTMEKSTDECASRASTIILSEDDDDDDDEEEETSKTTRKATIQVPLYPLPAVYLPTGQSINYTLNNIEARNIQMALDLQQLKDANRDPWFCVVLRALDTGRLTKVGTLMRMVDRDIQYHTENGNGNGNGHDSHDNTLWPRKIVVTCVAERLVDIQSVENPASLTLEHRLRHPKEYARATVTTTRNELSDFNISTECLRALQEQASNEYETVRQFYTRDDGAFDDLPLFGNWTDSLPILSPDSFAKTHFNSNNYSFWTSALVWQSLCHTIREGHQRLLASNRNEMLIVAAMKKGGPLKLPVRIEDVEPDDQLMVRELERSLQHDWEKLQLDPILDIQYLLELDTHEQRLAHLVHLIQRERKRLEQEVLMKEPNRLRLSRTLMKEYLLEEDMKQDQQQPRKGAWFNDEIW